MHQPNSFIIYGLQIAPNTVQFDAFFMCLSHFPPSTPEIQDAADQASNAFGATPYSQLLPRRTTPLPVKQHFPRRRVS
jgi:hypothetical protein